VLFVLMALQRPTRVTAAVWGSSRLGHASHSRCTSHLLHVCLSFKAAPENLFCQQLHFLHTTLPKHDKTPRLRAPMCGGPIGSLQHCRDAVMTNGVPCEVLGED
jgi:hypothetical protein